MKKIGNLILGIWYCIAMFISPIWLTIIGLNITGEIYTYDYSMDEGTAIIIGIMLLVAWFIFVFLPNIFFLKGIHKRNKKMFWILIGIGILLIIVCLGICNWNIVSFITK